MTYKYNETDNLKSFEAGVEAFEKLENEEGFLFDSRFLGLLGSKRAKMLPEDVVRPFIEEKGKDAYRFFGKIAIIEIKQQFAKFESTTQELEAKGFFRSAMDYTNSTMGSIGEVGLLNRLYDIAFSSRLDQLKASKLSADKLNSVIEPLKREMFEGLAGDKYVGYMNLTSLSYNSIYKGTIVPAGVAEKQQEKDDQELRRKYLACKSLEEKDELIRSLVVESERVYGTKVYKIDDDRIVPVLFGEEFRNWDNREAQRNNNKEMDFVDRAVRAYGRLTWTTCHVWKETQSGEFSSTHDACGRDKEGLETAAKYYEYLQSIGYVSSVSDRDTKYINFKQGTKFSDAVFITTTLFLAKDRGIKGEFRCGRSRIVLEPERFIINRRPDEPTISSVEYHTIVAENRRKAEKAKKTSGANERIKARPVFEG